MRNNDDSSLIATATKINSTWIMDHNSLHNSSDLKPVPTNHLALIVTCTMTLDEAHIAFAHRNHNSILRMYTKGKLPGIILSTTTFTPCVACHEGKGHATKVQKSASTISFEQGVLVADIVEMGIAGHNRPTELQSVVYFNNFDRNTFLTVISN